MTTEPKHAPKYFTIDSRLEFVDCMVEASSYERHDLWDRYQRIPAELGVGLRWEQDMLGRGCQIGELGGLPIWVSWSFDLIDGAVICFYAPTSRAVDHDVVQAWAKAICAKRTNAENFHNRPRFAGDSPNVTRFRHAVEAQRAEYRAALAVEMAKPAVPVDHEDDRLAATGIPEISDGQVAERLAVVTPIDETHRRIEHPADLRRIAYTWDPKFGDVITDIEPAKTVKTLHAYGYYGMFKPSIAEVLAQAPGDLHEYVAFSIQGPETSADLNRFPACLNAGYHVAEVTYYRRSKEAR